MTTPNQSAVVEAMARALFPDLFSDDPMVRHRAASPNTITHVQDSVKRQMEAALTEALPLIQITTEAEQRLAEENARLREALKRISDKKEVRMGEHIGHRVSKRSGDYQFDGEIVAVIRKRSGELRYAVEDDRGLLLIMNAKQCGIEAPPEYGRRSGGQPPSAEEGTPHRISAEDKDCGIAVEGLGATREAVEAEIVAWLRLRATDAFAEECADAMLALDSAADAVERGDHRNHFPTTSDSH